ncbi:hypothetical protein AGMMS49950_04090 [Endomicrobiia bacterium]|nr:hypothetical protein AGMMS49950_04090 [Endomicrobiia bacterium]
MRYQTTKLHYKIISDFCVFQNNSEFITSYNPPLKENGNFFFEINPCNSYKYLNVFGLKYSRALYIRNQSKCY